MDAAIPADAQNAPTGIWKSRTEREIPTAPTPIIVVVNERKNNGDSNSVAKPSTESDQAQSPADATYAVVTVQTHRDVSNAVARKLGVRHETPQALLVRDGRMVWSASHFRVTAAAVEDAISRSQPTAP